MKVLILILLLFCIEPSYCSSWRRVSRRVMKEQMKIRGNKEYLPELYIKMYNKSRKDIDVFNRLNICENDTLFLYEVHSDGSIGLCISSVIWTTSGNQLYYERESPKDSICFPSLEGLYDGYFCFLYKKELAERWDITTIQKESREHCFVEPYIIYLTRIILGKDSYKIDVMRFMDFSNFDM